jgi:hypothetical protein
MALSPREAALARQNQIRGQSTSSSGASGTTGEIYASTTEEAPRQFISDYNPKDISYANFDSSQIRELIGNLSITNLYQVNFSAITSKLAEHLGRYTDGTIDVGWISRSAGLLCTEASLPTSSFATAEVKDNFIGVTQEFAHTRLYTDLDLTFYVDADYNIIQFFEGWMDYISGASEEAASKGNRNHYRRFAYPNDYKIDTLHILKFDKNNLTWGETAARAFTRLGNNYVLQYDFINVFPKSITTIPISYGPAEIVKVSVSFNYDRYVQKRVRKSSVLSSQARNEQSRIESDITRTGSSGQLSAQEQLNAEDAARATQTSTTINPTIRRQGTDAFRGRR